MKRRFSETAKYGRLTPLKLATDTKYKSWECSCDCGKVVTIAQQSLLSGNTASCGCLKTDMTTESKRTHGGWGSKEYWVWRGILNRCINPKTKQYDRYGGRGISVSQEWMKFENFIADMGARPDGDFTIERIDNSGNYCKENCTWATRQTQQRNMSSNRLIQLFGKTLPSVAWDELHGHKPYTVSKRLRRGWCPTRAILQQEGARHAKR